MDKNNYYYPNDDPSQKEKVQKEENREWQENDKVRDLIDNIDSHIRYIHELKLECHEICIEEYNDFTSCHEYCERVGNENL